MTPRQLLEVLLTIPEEHRDLPMMIQVGEMYSGPVQDASIVARAIYNVADDYQDPEYEIDSDSRADALTMLRSTYDESIEDEDIVEVLAKGTLFIVGDEPKVKPDESLSEEQLIVGDTVICIRGSYKGYVGEVGDQHQEYPGLLLVNFNRKLIARPPVDINVAGIVESDLSEIAVKPRYIDANNLTLLNQRKLMGEVSLP